MKHYVNERLETYLIKSDHEFHNFGTGRLPIIIMHLFCVGEENTISKIGLFLLIYSANEARGWYDHKLHNFIFLYPEEVSNHKW